MNPTSLLSEYVQRTAVMPWAWGSQDCTIWAADWCLLRWGFDPARRYRGRYDTERGARLLTACGLAVRVGPEIPLPVKAAPDAGDLGIIEVAGRQVAAIRSERHWLFRTPRGVGFAQREAIMIWGD